MNLIIFMKVVDTFIASMWESSTTQLHSTFILIFAAIYHDAKDDNVHNKLLCFCNDFYMLTI